MIKTRDMTIGAMCCGLSVLFLYIAALIPTGRASVAFIATLMPAIVCVESEKKITALISGIAAGFLAAILVPKSGMAGLITIFFCCVLCYYPWLKSVIESLGKLIAEWIIKLVFFTAVSFVIDFTVKKIGIDGIEFKNIIVIASIGILIVYDFLLSYVMNYYIRVISPKIKKS